MTKPSDGSLDAKELPDDFLPEDMPFEQDGHGNGNSYAQPEEPDSFLPKKKPAKAVDDIRKFELGSSMLGWCLFLMFVCILLSL